MNIYLNYNYLIFNY